MTKLKLALLMSISLFLASCGKDKDNDPTNGGGSGNGNGNEVVYVKPASKKGADFSTNTDYGTWYGNVVNLKSHWFYTWGTLMPAKTVPQNCDFVPMFWGKGNVTTALIDSVKKLKAAGTVKYVLGFNEPDAKDQSNMSEDEALALWPQLESIGLPLGSPATQWPDVKWLYTFMDKAIQQKRRVDFICVHMYVGTDDAHFVKTLRDLYNKYQLPIWITEFATADHNAQTMEANMYKPEQVLAFMQRLLPQLEDLPYVHRYSWFSSSPIQPALWPSSLIAADGKLTTLGQWYANYKPNANIK
ncbi:glycosyl hydrolase [Chitinophaga pinensis]|uniref:Asl1-like glycosyl hydrolase catalytic domain-containing protein n=1 Tax=Chitinophaga pinensis (strain ATCC 43595 / DSM 2588 / LMG 13176 / NBRC 15968 / NCIMB 11800 / UQM 2034) TaxID=485918 RepID=A0A979GBL4_CHIPD|nr:glycosyl hydrolase [Chitinophaga pinensis]ACU64554.1 conserved hypothetical protein [Chitinophaga pinensis DSM 2588]